MQGRRPQDERALSRAISRFVQSHAVPSARSNQIGRWHEDICPLTTGLKPAFNDLVTRRVSEVIRGVGAPHDRSWTGCNTNVVIAFTSSPQGLLDFIAREHHGLLGYYTSAQTRAVTTISHPIEARYVTGTRSLSSGGGSQWAPKNGAVPDNPTGLLVDTDLGPAPGGTPGSHLGSNRRGEFMHVTVIVDANAVAGYPLTAIADYAAMLALTRVAPQDGCGELPSILDLLATGCGPEAKPAGLTDVDLSYLRALYAADDDRNVNIEQGDMSHRVLQEIRGR